MKQAIKNGAAKLYGFMQHIKTLPLFWVCVIGTLGLCILRFSLFDIIYALFMALTFAVFMGHLNVFKRLKYLFLRKNIAMKLLLVFSCLSFLTRFLSVFLSLKNIIGAHLQIRSRALLYLSIITSLIMPVMLIILCCLTSYNSKAKFSERKDLNKCLKIIMFLMSLLWLYSISFVYNTIQVLAAVFELLLFWLLYIRVYDLLKIEWQKNTIFCPSCSFENSVDKKFCIKCGYKLK